MQITSSNIAAVLLAIGLTVLLLSLSIFFLEELGVAVLFVIPVGLAFAFYLFRHPRRALDMALISSFIVIGVIRYVGDIPLGLSVDLFLITAIVIAVFHQSL